MGLIGATALRTGCLNTPCFILLFAKQRENLKLTMGAHFDWENDLGKDLNPPSNPVWLYCSNPSPYGFISLKDLSHSLLLDPKVWLHLKKAKQIIPPSPSSYALRFLFACLTK